MCLKQDTSNKQSEFEQLAKHANSKLSQKPYWAKTTFADAPSKGRWWVHWMKEAQKELSWFLFVQVGRNWHKTEQEQTTALLGASCWFLESNTQEPRARHGPLKANWRRRHHQLLCHHGRTHCKREMKGSTLSWKKQLYTAQYTKLNIGDVKRIVNDSPFTSHESSAAKR